MSVSSLALVADTARLLVGRAPRGRAASKRAAVRRDAPFGAAVRRFASIEDGLRACPAVREAVVLERADRPHGRSLVAYMCMNDGYASSAGAARAQLAHALPADMLPSTLVTLDAMPRGADGEIDLAALPAPDSACLGMRQYELPVGPLEKAIAAIWQELLGLERVGRNAHFFELGGHSSLGIQLVYRLRQETQVSIALRELFLEPTLHRFAAEVAKRIPSLGFAPSAQPDYASACALE